VIRSRTARPGNVLRGHRCKRKNEGGLRPLETIGSRRRSSGLFGTVVGGPNLNKTVSKRHWKAYQRVGEQPKRGGCGGGGGGCGWGGAPSGRGGLSAPSPPPPPPPPQAVSLSAESPRRSLSSSRACGVGITNLLHEKRSKRFWTWRWTTPPGDDQLNFILRRGATTSNPERQLWLTSRKPAH